MVNYSAALSSIPESFRKLRKKQEWLRRQGLQRQSRSELIAADKLAEYDTHIFFLLEEMGARTGAAAKKRLASRE